MLHTCLCVQCGASFTVKAYRVATAKYCSFACYHASMRFQETYTCEHCGKIFQDNPSRKSRYCSVQCCNESRERHIDRICPICNTPFTVRMSRPAERPGIYCSITCRGLARHQRISLTCEQCGRVYERTPANVERSRFCSAQCRGGWTANHMPNSRTSIEIAIDALLTDLSIVYRAQHSIGPYVCDFYVPEHRLVIECDGLYWHGLPQNQYRDATKDLWFSAHAYRVLRLPELKINNDLPWCKKQILRAIR